MDGSAVGQAKAGTGDGFEKVLVEYEEKRDGPELGASCREENREQERQGEEEN